MRLKNVVLTTLECDVCLLALGEEIKRLKKAGQGSLTPALEELRQKFEWQEDACFLSADIKNKPRKK